MRKTMSLDMWLLKSIKLYKFVLVIIILISFGHESVLASDTNKKKVVATKISEFNKIVKPFFKSYCIKCHGSKKQKADYTLHDIDGMITNGKDSERWEKALEMLSIGDMPPKKKKQPSKAKRKQVVAWISKELGKINRGMSLEKLAYPEYGNRVNHEELFSGEHKGPSSSPPRYWRKSPFIYEKYLSDIDAHMKISQPMLGAGGKGIQDFGYLLADEGTIKLMLQSSQRIAMSIYHGHVPFLHGKPLARRGSSFREFSQLSKAGSSHTQNQLDAAINRAFMLVFQRGYTKSDKKYVDLLKKNIKIGSVDLGMKSMLTAMLMSTEFVFRLELGLGKKLSDGRRHLSPNELAFAISFAIVDKGPDATLMNAVRDGKLKTKKDVEREVRRLLDVKDIKKRYWDYPQAHIRGEIKAHNPRLLRFFREFFGYHKVVEVFKDEARNRSHSPWYLQRDADWFVLNILENDKEVFKQLLTSNKYFVAYMKPKMASASLKKGRRRIRGGNGTNPTTYGNTYVTAYSLDPKKWIWQINQPFELPKTQRIGMLSHPAWLVAHSGNFDTDPIRRGKWIREHLLAGIVPEIPIGVDARVPEDPHRTLRERFDVVKKEECWRCHKKMNPLGMPFEMFDDFGRFRDKIKLDNNEIKPAIVNGVLSGTGDPKLDGPVKDAVDLINKLGASTRVRQSIIRHVFRYWMGRNETLDDSPTLMAADKAYVDSGGSFKELLVSLLTSDSFLYRK